MTRRIEINAVDSAVQVLIDNGFEGLAEAIEILLNEAMKIERSRALCAEPYERSDARRGYANGYKPKCVSTRIGDLSLDIPQVRGEGVEFYPSTLERGLRSERALKVAIAEMYVQGVSTRKVTKIVEQLCGTSVTSTEVSRAAKQLDAHLEAWKRRPLDEFPYLLVDAKYEKIRVSGSVESCGVLQAIGIDTEGRRRILGLSVSISEAEVHWREFFASLQERGLHGTKLIVSDDHKGLKAAIIARFPSVKRQRCQFHLQRNAVAYVTKSSLRKAVAADLRSIFDAPDRIEADKRLDLIVRKYADSMPKLSTWIEENVPDSLTVSLFRRNIEGVSERQMYLSA